MAGLKRTRLGKIPTSSLRKIEFLNRPGHHRELVSQECRRSLMRIPAKLTGHSGIVTEDSGQSRKSVTFNRIAGHVRSERPVTFKRNQRSRWSGIRTMNGHQVVRTSTSAASRVSSREYSGRQRERRSIENSGPVMTLHRGVSKNPYGNVQTESFGPV